MNQPAGSENPWPHDLGWAIFILIIAALMGMLQHWQLVRAAFQGELKPYLAKLRTQEREIRFQGVKTVSLAQAYARYQEGKTLFVDARDPEEYAELHIPGAVNLSPERLKSSGEKALAAVPRDRPLVVYCGEVSCNAALAVAEGLQKLGFSQVAAFLGGFRAWDEAGYPAETTK